MRKHLFTIRWERKGREAFPVFEFLFSFDWPDSIPPNEAIAAAARILGTTQQKMIDKQVAGLPANAAEAMRMLPGLHLRARYSPETMGPYIIPDPDKLLSEELLLTWVAHNEEKLKEYKV